MSESFQKKSLKPGGKPTDAGDSSEVILYDYYKDTKNEKEKLQANFNGKCLKEQVKELDEKTKKTEEQTKKTKDIIKEQQERTRQSGEIGDNKIYKGAKGIIDGFFAALFGWGKTDEPKAKPKPKAKAKEQDEMTR